MPLKRECEECGTELVFKANLHEGNDTGYGSEDLYQCPKCKNIEVR